jgi:glucoamylase
LGALKDRFNNWEIGLKDGLSSGLSENSSIHITIGRGILNETYFPSPDNITIHSLRFFINGLIDESTLPYEIKIKDLYAPLYITKSKYRTLTIEKEFLLDPENNILNIEYKFSEYVNGSFKIFPFLKDLINRSKNSITIKTETSFLKIWLDTNFKYERVDDFFVLNVFNINKTLIKIAFGKTINETEKAFKNSLDFSKAEETFLYQWKTYLNRLNLENKNNLFIRSVINIKSMEDKKHPGAVVASLALPWGSKFPLSEKNGYHLVWTRDLFYTSLAMYLVGDKIFAHSSLEYMLKYNKRPDGSFKQNSTIEGEERWDSTQMDQIAFPIILAYRLKRFDLLKELKKSADYIAKNGPYTEQERWEEIGGFSPYSSGLQSLALKMYGLMCKNSGSLTGSKYLQKAEEFKNMIKQYTFTTNGLFSNSYFTRITRGDPDTDEKVLELKGLNFSPKEMISTDFLYLVFTGLYHQADKKIIKSLEVVDKELRVNTPNGPSFYRYNNDIYGFDDPDNPKGKLWIILTCERGIFEAMRGNDANQYLRSIENFATKTYLLPEQINEFGEPTESATPLAWSHALYIILHEKINKKIHFLFR